MMMMMIMNDNVKNNNGNEKYYECTNGRHADTVMSKIQIRIQIFHRLTKRDRFYQRNTRT